MEPSKFAKRRKELAPQQRAEWRSWCNENAEWIATSGVPSLAFSDLNHWRSFLEIGDLHPADFDFKKLSVPQKVALLRVISTRPIDLSTPVAVGLVKSILDVMEYRA